MQARIASTCITAIRSRPSSESRNRQSLQLSMKKFSVSTAGHFVSRRIAKLLSQSGSAGSAFPFRIRHSLPNAASAFS